MTNHYPIRTALENELQEFDNPITKMLISLVGEYEHGTGDAEEVFDEDLVERLKQICAQEELRTFCLRLYASVARDIAMCAQD